MSESSTTLPDLVAHRGNAAEFPENTLLSLRSALELGAKYIEFDVQLTADHVPIVLHDSNLRRTGGVDSDVMERTWDELAAIRVGEAARFGTRFSDAALPTLIQVLQLLIRHPQAQAFVELKRASLRKFGHDVVVHRVCELLKPFASQVVIISFDLPALNYVRRQNGYRIGWVLSEYTNVAALKAEAIVPEYLFCDHQLLPAGRARLWRGPWQWAVYEVTELALARELAARDVKLIETMQVRPMLEALRQAAQ